MSAPGGPLPQAVLFACTMNRVRSPMAAALLQRRAAGRIFVDSCGVRSGAEEDPFVPVVLAERGLHLEPQASKTFDAVGASAFDLIVCLTPEAQARAEALARTEAISVVFWDIEDPAGVEGGRASRLEAYRSVLRELDRRIQIHFAPVLQTTSTSS